MTPTEQAEALLRLVLAGCVGAIIGLDRDIKDKPAGARTYGLVAMGACLFTLVGMYGFGAGDPSRVAAQIVTGIGFLGAGTIIQVRQGVVGLTTAAGIWSIAAVGMALGAGLYVLGLGTGALIFALLRFFRLPLALRRTDADHEPSLDDDEAPAPASPRRTLLAADDRDRA